MRIEIAIGKTKRAQVRIEQRKMQRLFGRDLQLVAIEFARHAGETPDGVQRKIDCIELDMRQRMNQCSTAFDRIHSALANVARRHQRWTRRTTGHGRLRRQHQPGFQIDALVQPPDLQLARLLDFAGDIGLAKQT